MAAIGVGAVLAEALFAQLTLALTICFVVTGKASRWRPVWLAAPATIGLAWVLAVGVKPAVTGFLAAGARVVAVLAGHGTLSARLASLPRKVLGTWWLWLPAQAPVAILAACAQAAVLRRTRVRPARGYRPGGIAFMRNRYVAMTLRRGEVATADGCCLGVISETGGRAAVSWAEAEAGVLCTGDQPAAVTATGLVLTVAAIQHRKSVIVIDLADEQSADPIADACSDVAAPLRRFGRTGMHYDPLSGASPAGATSLVMAMVDWTGLPHAERLACANYLNAALTVLGTQPSAGVLAELIGLLEPAALRTRLGRLRGRQASHATASQDAVGKVAELLSRIEGGQAVLTGLAGRLAALETDAAGAWLRPAPGAISLGRALAEREVVHFRLGRPRPDPHDGPAAMIARLAVADLIDNLGRRSDAGYRGDCAVWINGCEAIDPRQLGVLTALGERTGTSVMLGTADPAAAARLAADVNVIVARGSVPGDIDVDDLAELLTTGRPDQLAMSVQRPVPRLTACTAVR